jgi:hypothetical protein
MMMMMMMMMMTMSRICQSKHHIGRHQGRALPPFLTASGLIREHTPRSTLKVSIVPNQFEP